MGIITYILLLISFIHFSDKPLVDSSSASSTCIETELEALAAFKASSNNLLSWTGRDCCSWDGITCNNLTGHVERLQLEEFKFNSPLSPWLFNLTRLEVLSMRDSGLVGLIPNLFDKLTSLDHLDLSSNSFDSAVFPDSLCNLTSLTYMNLSQSQIQGSLPSCLGNMTSLTSLHLEYNELSGEIPSELGLLTHLTSLTLFNNHFNSSIPSTFGNLKHLEYLHLRESQLSGAIPSTLRNLTKLRYLDLSSNSLMAELSESILDGFKSLEFLAVSSNYRLVFNVSSQWIPPFNIQTLHLSSIFIGTQFPPWLQTQTNLEVLIMKNVSIYGPIPDWSLTGFPNLTHIELCKNFLNGTVPNTSAAFLKVDFLSFSYNLLSGPIPTFDGERLRYLFLSRNLFSGNIPQELCNLPVLKSLTLAHNQLTGGIPFCVGRLSGLSVLNLANNSLSGHIPNELGSLRSLKALHLNKNRFSGEFPLSLQSINLLTTLDLGENYLHGSIPIWIGKNRSSLQYLRLESNNFSGEIPINLCQLPSLQILNLAFNNLVGTIPPCIGNLSMMVSDESGSNTPFTGYAEALVNNFKGKVRDYSSSLPYAKFISLSSNHLHGEIPDELVNLIGLQSLNLSNNDLTGMIPKRIDNMKHLESLDLSMNRLHGTIPQSLANIDALSYLNLSFNHFQGKVPSGNHFDTLITDPSIYKGNTGLCGKMLIKSCPGDDSATSNQPNGPVSDDELDELSWMYAGIEPGFVAGFLGVIFILYFKRPWRTAFFGFADSLCDKVWVTMTIKISQIRRKFN